MVLAVNWVIEKKILPESTVWCGEGWKKVHVLKGNEHKLCWDFEYKMKKTSTACRPDITLEDERQKKIWLVDM